VDGPFPSSGRTEIEAAARDIGVAPGDPAYPFMQAMLRVLETAEHIGVQPAPVLTDRQVADIGRQVAAAAHAEVDRMVRKGFTRAWTMLLLAGLGAIAISFGAGWFTGRAGPTIIGEQQCQAQADGSTLCWVPLMHRK
jgi:hypothetical protein